MIAKRCLPILAACCITTGCNRTQGVSEAEQLILERIRQVRELRTAATIGWPGLDATRYDTPPVSITDSICYAVNPTPQFCEKFAGRLAGAARAFSGPVTSVCVPFARFIPTIPTHGLMLFGKIRR